MTFLADFEVREVAQELLASQGAPASAENLSRAMNAIIADPNIARATVQGNDLYHERVLERGVSSEGKIGGPGRSDASFSSGLDLFGDATGNAQQQPRQTSPINAVRPDGADGGNQRGTGPASDQLRGDSVLQVPGNSGGSASGGQANARELPSDIPIIPGTVNTADTQIDNASDGLGLLEMLITGGGAAAAGAGIANRFMNRGGAQGQGAVNLQPQDVAVSNTLEGEFIPGAARGAAQLGTPQGPEWQYGAVNQLDNLTGEFNAPTTRGPSSNPSSPMGGGGPDVSTGGGGNVAAVRTFPLNETGVMTGADGRPVAFNQGDPRATPQQVQAVINDMLSRRQDIPADRPIADAILSEPQRALPAPTEAPTNAPQLQPTAANMGPDVPIAPEAAGAVSESAVNPQEQLNRKIDVQRRGAQNLVNQALGQNALHVDFDGSIYKIVSPNPDGSQTVIGHYRNLNMLRNDLGRVRKEVESGNVQTRAPELRGGDPPSLDGPRGMPGDGEMDLVGATATSNPDELNYVKDHEKYANELRQRIANGEGNQAENRRELKKVEQAIHRLSSVLR